MLIRIVLKIGLSTRVFTFILGTIFKPIILEVSAESFFSFFLPEKKFVRVPFFLLQKRPVTLVFIQSTFRIITFKPVCIELYINHAGCCLCTRVVRRFACRY